jgi:serine/tyrosine/threonine adenylyltransferase
MTKSDAAGWRFDNSYLRLPQILFKRQAPRAVSKPRLLMFNDKLALELGLDAEWLKSECGVQMLAGNVVAQGSEPIAQAYAGHQFGNFTMLGDGRAILLGEHLTPDGRRFDIQLKGSGRTPFSRGGDGLAAVGPMVREYIMSEAMHALGIPTTRSLAVIGTGDKVVRGQVLDGAVLTRVASSHIRIGTFEFAAAYGDSTVIRELLDYTILRHYPALPKDCSDALSLLEHVVERQAELVARWMLVGFVHGVMNTDNIALSGETIDYGPCAFIDSYDPATVFSSIDSIGRYAFGNQPAVAQWNLARFAETLLPLIAPDESDAVSLAEPVIDRFSTVFKRAFMAGMLRKLGLKEERPGDIELIESLLSIMHKNRYDYTVTFRRLGKSLASDAPVLPETPEQWQSRWIEQIDIQAGGRDEAAMLCAKKNPSVVPRNHLVEEALAAIDTSGNYDPVKKLLDAITHPFESGRCAERYELGPEKENPQYRTFCGT